MDSLIDDAKKLIDGLKKRSATNSWTVTILERLVARVESLETPITPVEDFNDESWDDLPADED